MGVAAEDSRHKGPWAGPHRALCSMGSLAGWAGDEIGQIRLEKWVGTKLFRVLNAKF